MNTLIKTLLVIGVTLAAVWISCGGTILIWATLAELISNNPYAILFPLYISMPISGIIWLITFIKIIYYVASHKWVSWNELFMNKKIVNLFYLIGIFIACYFAFSWISSLVWSKIMRAIPSEIILWIASLIYIILCYYFLIKRK